MATDLMQDQGQGSEIQGMRITVYHLLPYFLDRTATEAYIARLYDLTPEQVAAARAYVFNNLETVLAQHLNIEARIAAGNPPEVIEKAKRTRETILKFKEWLVKRQQTEAEERAAESAIEKDSANSSRFPTFREWYALPSAIRSM